MVRRNAFIILIAAAGVLVIGSDAYAWGPATHIQFANELLAKLALLPSALAVLLARHARSFIFGNIAADVVFAKKLSHTKQICHQWTTGFALVDSAESDDGRAFGWGYLAHLAADTVAHNKYLPHQMVLSGSTISFGHLYWEVRADALISPDRRTELRGVLRQRYPEPERLLEQHLTRTLLPFPVNRHLFRRMNLLACERSWHRSIQLWSAVSRWPLDRRTLADFHHESLDRIVSVLRQGHGSAVLHDDPNGNAALGYARAQRRQLRQLRRARLPVAHIVREAASNHAPHHALAAAAHENIGS